MSWDVDVTLNATATSEPGRIAGNVEGQANRDQAKWVLSHAAAALGHPIRSDGSPGANLGKDNDTYRVVASGDGQSYFTLSVERVF